MIRPLRVVVPPYGKRQNLGLFYLKHLNRKGDEERWRLPSARTDDGASLKL
nr:MAG TPA: hypothetical protein [Caudoviricetes sp.]